MRRIIDPVRRLLLCTDGTTAIEYSVMLALILLLVVAAVQTLGCNLKTTFEQAVEQLPQ